jgi:hypothetical protein
MASASVIKTIRDVYNEWHYGWDGHTSIKDLIKKYKNEWRIKTSAETKTYSRRKQIIDLIEQELKSRQLEEVIDEFERERGTSAVSTWIDRKMKKPANITVEQPSSNT